MNFYYFTLIFDSKTTLLGVVSGEFPPSAGTATLAGLDILNDIHRIRHRIGYCPQFDALFDLLTGREHLMLYAQIKGLKKDSIIPAVNAKIAEMGLTEYADRSAGTYSGGKLKVDDIWNANFLSHLRI